MEVGREVGERMGQQDWGGSYWLIVREKDRLLGFWLDTPESESGSEGILLITRE